MDTPTIAEYYKEKDPMKRRKLLDKSIEAGEEPQENQIRQELWEIRYQDKSEAGQGGRSDGYLGMWMAMEFEKGSANRLFGIKSARKSLQKHIDKLKLKEMSEKSELHAQLLYREWYHAVVLYLQLSQTDRNYSSYLLGMLSMKEADLNNKIKNDIYKTAIALPEQIKMTEELDVITRAAKAVYRDFFPDDDAI